MKIIRFAMPAILLLFSYQGIAQHMSKQEAEFFILGTLSDYMGRQLDPRFKNLLDRYDGISKPVADAVDSLIHKNYPNVTYNLECKDNKWGRLNSCLIYSDSLSARFNNYYNFKPSGSRTLEGEDILTGRLEGQYINTPEKKLAFIAGAYARFGAKCDTAFYMRIANGTFKATVCTQILKELGCKPYYDIKRNYIPVGHHIFFHPSPKLYAYLSRYSIGLNHKLRASLDRFIQVTFAEAQQRRKQDSIAKALKQQGQQN